MYKWTVAVVLSFTPLAPPLTIPGSAAELKPLMAGWEQYFTVTWEPAENRGKPVLQGYVNNISPYTLRAARILVETLDGAGETTSQRVAWVPSDMQGATRLFFEVPVAPSPSYRVRVFSYDRQEFDGNFR
jgi:hypothetical protein